MAECECLKGCPFFNDKMHGMPTMLNIYKEKYCLTSPAQCARYYVFKRKGKPAVPTNLYPNQMDKAKKIAG